ncbi:N,N-dimethylformamidase beta subunit family domain-containing protein [Aeromicrobium sp. CF4.19]|uniref:N,N-dimethylformamidase beta subunit family domain-containing protein n=1 Tax=Aeromicrobium sp. CF4.19 TaxID=3373082 RepID=UPI003EE5CD39
MDLFISSTVSELDLRIYRDGFQETTVHQSRHTPVSFQPVAANAYEAGCGWTVTDSWTVPEDLEPGPYLVEMRDSRAPKGARPLGHHFFIVRSPAAGTKAIVQVLATCTWSAYNDWGGASHYFGLTPDTARGRSPILSTQRPWARGQVWLPDGAPRMVSPARPSRPQPPRYEFVEWAYLNGYAKYYAASGWATYERHFFRWAEAQGHEVDLLVQEDLHAEAEALSPYRCAVFSGHDEYWTTQMRSHVDDYVAAGGHVARFAGNFMWQIRLDLEQGQQVAYKYDATTQDPVAGTEAQHLLTGAWEEPAVGNPGATTFGVNALRGMYAGFGAFAPRSSRGYTIFRPEHWSLDSTGLGYADTVGDEAAVFSYEVDGLDYVFRDGLPYPSGTDGAPENLQIIAMNWSTAAEDGRDVDESYFMLGDGDARYRASIAGEDYTEQNRRRFARGAGMIVSFQRGAGEVFTAGTCEWVNGLRVRDHYVTAITDNVLRKFGGAARRGGPST